MKKKFRLSYTKTIGIGFALLILTGTLLLCLPVSSRSGEWTPFVSALFTSTSATCVTGLVVVDTATYWSLFGQIVILALIQVGGLGFMSVIAMFSLLLRRQIGLRERQMLMESSGSLQLSGIIRLLRKILFGTFSIELLGAVVLSTVFIPKMGFLRGVYNAVFHSVSAFCNAGFDLMGKYSSFSSLTLFRDNVVVNLTVCTLIIVGGIGYFVWGDVLKNKLRISKYELHSKIVLVTSAVLIVGGTVLFYLLERGNTLSSLSEGDRWLASFFQSVSPRTAGFNTLEMSQLTRGAALLTIVLMFIGGSPGSTAGGIKTTTAAVLLFSAFTSARRNNSITVFKRRLEDKTARQASAVVTVYLICITVVTTIISTIEPYSMGSVLFETVSAMGTVGLTTGITPSLCTVSKLLLAFLMYSGRVGGLTLMLILAEKRKNVNIERPTEKILIG